MSVLLDDREKTMLAIEAARPRHNGPKEELIREKLGMSAARYYQLLGRLIDTEQAMQHDPILVGRLRRARDARVQKRAVRMYDSTR